MHDERDHNGNMIDERYRNINMHEERDNNGLTLITSPDYSSEGRYRAPSSQRDRGRKEAFGDGSMLRLLFTHCSASGVVGFASITTVHSLSRIVWGMGTRHCCNQHF
ncbi:hypothetical protein CEXT_370481 [Caerostris extrusa]|uniref:Uncharacterized protein n=1 Tax=Caerostris extrusa TaxID=172846 RepID=A0AAV4M4X4_CAEEX|nr:hypothetical protein CEXT_370481 [Caerostris extrusa]